MDLSSPIDCVEQTNKNNTKDLRLNCVIPDSPLGKELKLIITKYWHILQTEPSLTEFSTLPCVVHKRPPNLNNNLPSITEPHFLDSYRTAITDAQCHFTEKTKTFKHPRSGQTFPVKG